NLILRKKRFGLILMNVHRLSFSLVECGLRLALFFYIIGKEHRRSHLGSDPFFHLSLAELLEMPEGQLAERDLRRPLRCRLPRTLSVDDNIEERVSHQAVPAVNTAGGLSRHE